MTGTATIDDLWIRRYQHADPGEAQLVCLPHAGGSAAFFLPMARGLAGRCEVLAVQYPGRQDRRSEPLLESVDEIVEGLLPVLRRQARGPVALFGHSLGATVAFELARRLEALGTAPDALFVSARPAPSRHRAGGTVHLGTDDQLIARLRSLSGTAEQVLGDEELLRLTLPAVRSDYKAAETYRYQPGRQLSCPVHALIGREDPMVAEDEARAWSDHTTGSFVLHAYSGGHFYLADHQQEILGVISEQLLL
ncbi:alpha/beta fold hydrolase [Streptomyces sp. NPDC050803]|uniref:thioesterase II family protein n=1 Tax=unclassified Streptomyces TaxID=2593676 RepID=UPI0034392775